MAQKNVDLENLGRNIQEIVDRAVSSHDYRKLNQTVSQTVDRAGDVLRQAAQTISENVRNPVEKKPKRQLYGKTNGKAFKAIVKMIFGFPSAVALWLVFLFGQSEGVRVLADFVSAVAIAACAVPFTWMAASGLNTWKRIGRFKAYCRTIGENTCCSLGKLSRSVGKTTPFVLRDVHRMIRDGMFIEGHLDNEETCLITSDETYRYFEESRLQLEERKRLEAAEAAEEARRAAIVRPPQVQEVLDRGNAFLTQIRKCNDEIPGIEISEKISRMENIVQRIFRRAEAAPEIVPDLKKLMDYYLPMTVKLLNAYAEMDSQPVQGENIQSAKGEIEGTLDTLNRAYEKLLDELYADTAIDVSSDISVLNTLLAQEGLTEDGIGK